MTSTFDLNFPATPGRPPLQAEFRTQPDDFFVDEVLGFSPSGEGEHVLLQVEKRGQNTHWVAKLIADIAGVKEQDIGYCGRKDRHAVTRQWFSVYWPKTDAIDWSSLNSEDIQLLAIDRHRQKLRPGMHLANHFVITLRNLRDENTQAQLSANQRDQLQERLAQLAHRGVPNYFGAQRFGRDGANLNTAYQWLIEGESIPRRLRSMALSSARSLLFNRVLAYRIEQDNWLELLTGDVEGELPTGPMWGRGRTLVSAETADLEQTVLADFERWCDALEHRGLQQQRRPLVLQPADISSQWQDSDWVLSFTLPAGSFATALLAELMTCQKPSESVSD